MSETSPAKSSESTVESGVPSRTATCIMAAVAIGIASYQAWLSRSAMNSDGLSYLEVGDALIQHRWSEAVVGLWSPLYALLLALLLKPLLALGMSLYPATKVVNLLVFVLATYAWSVMEKKIHRALGVRRSTLSVVVTWSLFIWSAVALVGVAQITPDMLVLACTFSLVGIFLDAAAGRSRHIEWKLGGVAGLSYLAKLAVLPVAGWFVISTAFVQGARGVRRTLLVTLPLAFTLAALWFVPLSVKFDRLTFGEAGKLNYAWYAAGAPRYTCWSGGDGTGKPVHPPAILSVDPLLLSFATPFTHSTYPPWHDPAFWFDGLRTRFDANEQWNAIQKTAESYWQMLRPVAPSFVMLLLLGVPALLASAEKSRIVVLCLVTAGAVEVLSFLPVHVEPRYVAGGLTLLVLPFAVTAANAKGLMGVIAAMCVIPLLFAAWTATSDARGWKARTEQHDEILKRLVAARLQSDDEVVAVGSPFSELPWARRAGIRFTAQVPDNSVARFLASPPMHRRRAYEAAARQNIRAFIGRFPASRVPATEGWIKLDESSPPENTPLWLLLTPSPTSRLKPTMQGDEQKIGFAPATEGSK